MTKPFLKWAGGKSRVADELLRISQERPNSTDWPVVSGQRYHEPFLGSGAMYFGLRSNGFIQTKKGPFLNDINTILINCMKVVSDSGKLTRMIKQLESLQTDYSKQERNPRGQIKEVRQKRMYYIKRTELNSLSKKLSSLTVEEEIRLAALMIFLNKTCYNGLWRMNRKGEFNVPEGDYDSPTNICQESVLDNCHGLMNRAKFSSKSWRETFSKVEPGDLVYLDPPYMPLEIDGNTFTSYYSGGFSKEDHIELAKKSAQMVAERGPRVIASNHDALGEPTIREIWQTAADNAKCDWAIKPIRVSRSISCRGHGRIKVNEVLIFLSPKK